MNSNLLLGQDKDFEDLQTFALDNVWIYAVVAIGFIVVSVTVFALVKYYRNRMLQQQESIDHLTDFRKMEEDGLLLDKEMATIKKIVSNQQYGSEIKPEIEKADDQGNSTD